MEEALDEIIETMETLVEEYDEQEVQLDKMQWTLSHLKYGYNSLRQQLSNTECSASEVFTSAGLLSEHIEQSTMSVEISMSAWNNLKLVWMHSSQLYMYVERVRGSS